MAHVDDPADAAETADRVAAAPARTRSAVRWVSTGLAIVVVLGGLAGWLAYRNVQNQAAAARRTAFLEVGKQGALNLTTIDWQEADRDVRRILDSATGVFHDQFATQSQPFVDVVKQSRSITVGAISEAGVESESGDSAQVLVAVTVKTTNAAAPQQETRSWRMRIGVQRVGADTKVANVEFVP